LKSFEFRNTERFLRNSFYCVGNYDMPVIYKQSFETDNLSLIGFHNTKSKDSSGIDRTVHFFIDDHKFECVWNAPAQYIGRLSQYKAVLSPDFSMYTNMPLPSQIWNTFRRRWCSAYWQANGLTVIPTVTWSDERSFEFCFDGIEKGSVVAVSTVGSRKGKKAFLNGFTELCRRLKPEKVLCYYNPFEEMLALADIITLPYEGILVREQKCAIDAGEVS
jgi:hypothetical protein